MSIYNFKKFTLLSLLGITLFSCTMEKRLHRKGYHVEWINQKTKSNKKIKAKTNEKLHLTERETSKEIETQRASISSFSTKDKFTNIEKSKHVIPKKRVKKVVCSSDNNIKSSPEKLETSINIVDKSASPIAEGRATKKLIKRKSKTTQEDSRLSKKDPSLFGLLALLGALFGVLLIAISYLLLTLAILGQSNSASIGLYLAMLYSGWALLGIAMILFIIFLFKVIL